MYDVKPITTNHKTACGCACLAMLLQFYGHQVSLDELIAECNPGVAGVTIATLKRVGNAHGLDLIPYKMDAEGVITMDRPAIIHWRYTHYVVFCGMDDSGEVVICNSNSGKYSIPVSDFKRFFTGYVLSNGKPCDLFEADYFGENPVEPDDYFSK